MSHDVNHTPSRRAFTLVELSIVLVILGLLVGGILAGQSVIKNARMRGTIKEMQNYTTAVSLFRRQYNSFPGDIPNATRYWGAAAGSTTADGYDATCAALTLPAADPKATCNGNGDGLVAINTDAAQTYERFRAWQHLVNAEFIEGNYAGVNGQNNSLPLTIYQGKSTNSSTNTALSNGTGFYTIVYMISSSGLGAEYFAYPAGNILFLGASTVGLTSTGAPLLQTTDAFHIDQKIDDGAPDNGNIMSYKGTGTFNPNCTVLSGTWSYNLTATGNLCALMYRF